MSLPLDCIGEIVQYLSDHRIIYNILLTSKYVKNFIENKRLVLLGWVNFPLYVVYYNTPVVDIYITFRDLLYIIDMFSKIEPPRTIFSHIVYKLCTLKELTVAQEYELNPIYLRYMVNLENLEFEFKYSHKMDGKCLRNLNKLTHLYGPCCIVINNINDLISKTKMKELTVYCICNNVSEDIFMNMQDLEVLTIYCGNMVITSKTFKRLPKLIEFVVPTITSLVDEDLKYIGKDLVQLGIESCDKITNKGLSYIDHEFKIINLGVQWSYNG